MVGGRVKLVTKLMALGGVLAVVPLVLASAAVWRLNWRNAEIAASADRSAAIASLEQVVESIHSMCDAARVPLKEAVRLGLNGAWFEVH